MSAPSASVQLDPAFIEEVSNRVTEHKKRRLLSSSSSDEHDAETMHIRTIVGEAVTKAMEGINASIQALINKQELQIKKIDTLVEKVDKNEKLIQNCRSEVDILRKEQHTWNEEAKSNLKANNKNIQVLKGQMIKIQQELEKSKLDRRELLRKNIDLEARSRRNNLIFYGIEEDKDESNEQSEQKIISFLKEKLQLQGNDKKSLGIQRAHRLGKPSNKTRPIIVLFSDYIHKEEVRGKRHSLKAPFGISEDFPYAVRKARQSLIPQLKELKKTVPRATIAYPARLVSPDKLYTVADVVDFAAE